MNELTVRIALRELVDRYAGAVDRKQRDEVAALFMPDGELLIHGRGEQEPRRAYRGRKAIVEALGGLDRYDITTHLVGNQLLDVVEGSRVTGETYCQASHLYGDRIYVVSVRYEDVFVYDMDRWLFAVRRQRVDWAEDRPFHPGEF
ncbi:MAG: nuclear transport factor 2 family protein [Streptosporangiaceae bacterium]